ncbi:L,D-transpeptidase family protein [Pseudomonas sp. MTM4]|uniref:L,D-transpeptidase family protein n=1 Tax=unclassified Pseudomonas TaxID=196821 RepID=UPI0018D25F47|nr:MULTISPECIES: L,D-transpeptidase family protein [unclassified Pseudomonas]MBC8650063.1 L,D-transpeptidase family protein [Pseudomonas sp. MT4]QXY92389.1 L,D-transpeptidase family protein [Pseudomonas sp. MTM4]
MYKKHAVRLVGIFCLAPALAFAQPASNPVKPIQSALENLASACASPLADIDQTASRQLTEFYSRQQFEALWTSYEQIDTLLAQLDALVDDGLNPAAYHPAAIRRSLYTATAEPLHRECGDILATHVYLLALRHLSHGRLPQDRLEPVWRSTDAVAPQRADERLLEIADAGLMTIVQAFDQARPTFEQYHNLRKAHARLRAEPAQRQLLIPAGETLRPGMSDARVPLLRQRLAASGYLPDIAVESVQNRYDRTIEQALKAFQARHGLQDDGILGVDTLATLNVTPSERLDQLKINLERFRWLSRDIEARSLLVDIAGGRVVYFRDGRAQWETRSQVGRATRQTPEIKSTVTRLTLNPTWTVPPTILSEDKLPKIREDHDYLAEQDLQVLDYEGNPLDPEQIDWNDPGRILLRQAAGPNNPLGRLVVRFDNPFAIYLHDTPSQGLFDRSQRAFSSGCVRVESVMQLVDLLLTDGERERFARLLETGKTHEFRLTEPTPVLLAYWTAEADDTGEPHYRPDIYQRDPDLIASLRMADQKLLKD